jgi:hypothetical protein
MERSRFTAWLVALGVIVVAFAGTVITLNLTLYSASGFTSSYLSALARHDVSGAMGTAGVTLPSSGSRALLRADALGGLADIRLVKDSTAADGSHRLTYSYTAAGTHGSTTFSVERNGVHLGLFSAWRFATSPAGVLSVTPEHAASFTANGVSLTPAAGENQATRYIVLAPAGFVLAHRSSYLVAPAKTVVVSRASSVTTAAVDVQADPTFVKDVQKELNAYLKKCVTQHVLLPTGCPMGQQITDRVQDTPVWSMIANPKVTIQPGTSADSWAMPSTPGTAHLVVTVKSIFDGTVSKFDKDVPFEVSYVITIRADNTLLITAQF